MVRFVEIEGWEVRLRCRACGAVAHRSVRHLTGQWNAWSTEEVERRARCLAYVRGVRCGGRAAVTLQTTPTPAPKHADHWGPPSPLPWAAVAKGPREGKRLR